MEMSTVWILITAINLFGISANCLTPDEIEAQRSGWNVDPNTQYHIQTDEGPERYFRFQTLNGQFRKEKRLEDGTVIGTEGWLDPLGYLRIKDYIADREGFRILKSKTIFVGKDRHIEDAIATSKRVPAQTGTLVKPRRPPNPFRQSSIQEFPGNSIEVNTVKPYRRLSSSVDSSKRFIVSTTPSSYIRSNYYSSTIKPIGIINNGYNDISKPIKNYISSNYQINTPYNHSYRKSYPHVNKSEIDLNKSNQFNNLLPSVKAQSETNYDSYRPDRRRFRVALASGRFNNTIGRPTLRRRRPIYTNDKIDNYAKESNSMHRVIENNKNQPTHTSTQTSDVVTSDYEFPPYDGTHKTADGFQYYLKSHYHEEEQKHDKSIGSYGYIDPFGIRRVVYYKADGDNGFVHKKNNRYVGFNATPYDPVPPKV